MADYLLPEGVTVPAATHALCELLNVRDGRVRAGQRSYYDTFDGRLTAAGLAVVWEDGELALIERAGARVVAGARMGKPSAPLFAREIPAGRLADALVPLIDVRALLPLIEIRGRQRPLDVLNAEGKTVVRLRVQEASVGRRRLRARAQLRPVRGYDKAYRRVAQAIEERLGFEPAGPVVDEALQVAGTPAGGVSAKVDVALTGEQRADAAAALLLTALLDVIEANRDGAVRDLDSEFLHDLRVAVRRSRALQRELRGVFPSAELPRFRQDFRWLQQATGDARDLDVYVLEFESMRGMVPEPARGELEPLLGVLRTRRAAARRRMVRALRSERARTMLHDWRRLLEGLESLPAEDRPQASEPIARLAGARIGKVYRRMVKMGEAIGPFSPSEDYHELRKQGKELRYLLELLGVPLYPEPAVRPMIKALKALQDVLGRHQDREIQVAMLRALGPEVAAASGGADAVMAMGMLVERLEADQRAAREDFAERFAAFAARRQRRVVDETFV
jgi:CHAD domain-containing protein